MEPAKMKTGNRTSNGSYKTSTVSGHTKAHQTYVRSCNQHIRPLGIRPFTWMTTDCNKYSRKETIYEELYNNHYDEKGKYTKIAAYIVSKGLYLLEDMRCLKYSIRFLLWPNLNICRMCV